MRSSALPPPLRWRSDTDRSMRWPMRGSGGRFISNDDHRLVVLLLVLLLLLLLLPLPLAVARPVGAVNIEGNVATLV